MYNNIFIQVKYQDVQFKTNFNVPKLHCHTTTFLYIIEIVLYPPG